MPLLDKIIVMPNDLVNILERINQVQHCGPFEIIDTNGTFTIRDINGQSLGDIKKVEPVETGS